MVVVGLSAPVGASAGPKKAAQEGEGEVVQLITLETDKRSIRIGNEVRLSGLTEPATPDQTIEIRDAEDSVLASAETDDDGEYSVTLAPRRKLVAHAVWGEVSSEPVSVAVIPKVTVKLKRVRLFGTAVATGHVSPKVPGGRMKVTLRRFGKVVNRKTVTLRRGRRFKVPFAIKSLGGYRATATMDPDNLARASDRSGLQKVKVEPLAVGSKGVLVKLLEKRLRGLGYYIPSADKRFDEKTSDALIAFNKVQGTARVGRVDDGTWRRLADPKRATARFGGRGRHFEIDQTKQVILVVENGNVRWILHTSTGANGATHDGTYRVFRKLAGYSPGRLYYPSYWDGGRAFHGWPEVPTYNASHGCARIPMWSATWVFSLTEIGSEVHVYH